MPKKGVLRAQRRWLHCAASGSDRKAIRALWRHRKAAYFRHRKRRRAEERRRRAEEAYLAAITPPGPETLETIASCESGGDPTITSPNGTYRGKYQFDYLAWESVGGSGDPAAAPEREQDIRAAMLYRREGGSPWPVCAG